MKLLYTLLFTIALTGTYTVAAQTTQYNPSIETDELSEYNKVYQEYKTLYIKKLDSESFFTFIHLSQDFLKKLNHPEKLEAFAFISDPLVYIKENLSNTLFESYDTAEAEWEALETAKIKEWQENKEYYDLRKKITQRWGVRMVADVGDEIEKEFPEKFKYLNDN